MVAYFAVDTLKPQPTLRDWQTNIPRHNPANATRFQLYSHIGTSGIDDPKDQ